MEETKQELEKETKELTLANNPRHYQKLIYKYCKENFPGIIKMAKVFIDHVKEDFDNHVSVEGGTGSGKSAYTFILVSVMHELMNKTFSIPKHCLFIPNEGELMRKVRNLDNYGVFWLDEAIRALDKKRWYNSDQIDLNHTVKTERWRNNSIFYNIQRFAELTETFRNDNIYFRIFIIKKHAAILYVKDEDKDIEDPWHIKANISIKYKNKYGATRYNPLLSVEARLNKERKLPNYFMDTLFPAPDAIPEVKEYWEYYKALKEKSRADAKEKQQEKKDKAGTNSFDLVYRKKLAAIAQKTLKENPELTKKDVLGQLGVLDLASATQYNLFKLDVSPLNSSINNTNREKEDIPQT